ncbi:MAG: Gfo/Idh/MocA family oxidoreductase [Rudaea sp.]
MGAGSEPRPLSLALVGMGRQGRRHLDAAARLRDSENISLTAVVDCDAACADLAAEGGAEYFGDVSDLPADIDACVVATPTSTHLSVARFLLGRGIDLLVEKPVAASYAQTHALVRLAAHHGRILQVGYLERYHPSFTNTRPDFSAPAEILAERSTRGDSIRTLADLVRELMIHDLDILATWLDCTPLSATWSALREGGRETRGTLELLFAGGHRARLVAESGAHTVVRRTTVKSHDRFWEFEWSPGAAAIQTHAGADDPITAQLRAFVRAVRDRCNPHIDGNSALRAMRLAEKAIHALPTAA